MHLHLKILHYNVQMIFEIHINTANDLRAELIANEIGNKYKNIDIITFCEAFTQNSRIILINNLKKYGFNFYTPVLSLSNIKGNGGIFIISKHPILNYKFYVYNSTSGTDSLVEKGILKATLLIKNNIIHVFTTHLQSWENYKNEMTRIKQLEELQNFINEQKKKVCNIIIKFHECAHVFN